MKPFYRKYQGGYAAIAGAVGAIGGALIGANSAGNASDAQAQGGREANATTLRMFNQTRADNADLMNNGRVGNNALAYRLGLSPTPSGSQVDYSVAPTSYVAGQSNNPLWDRLLNNFNAQHTARYGIAMNRDWNSDPDAMTAKGQLDAQYKAALATDPEMQALIAKQGQQQTTANNDPQYGSLLKKFTVADFNADPVSQLGFKFGLDEGTKGIYRQASANGGLDTGATLKALTRFSNDYGNSKAGESRNRFVADQDSEFNKLSGISGSGQVASQQVGTAGMNAGNQISQNQIGVGNARGASAIAQGNAVSGALTGGYNNYQQNRLVDGYLARANRGSTGSTGGGYAYTDPYEVDGVY